MYRLQVKRKATGDRGIPEAVKFYLDVHYPRYPHFCSICSFKLLPSHPSYLFSLFHLYCLNYSSSLPIQNAPLYFNKEWSIGKVIDVAASAKRVTNQNNIAGATVSQFPPSLLILCFFHPLDLSSSVIFTCIPQLFYCKFCNYQI